MLNIVELELTIADTFGWNLLLLLGDPAFLCIMASTMFFNLKEAVERGSNQGTSYRLRSVSAMEFA